MNDREMDGSTVARCSTCGHDNHARAEWCDRCLADFDPTHRRLVSKELTATVSGGA